MDSFQDFDQHNAPQRASGEIISHAFEMYKGVFLYALLAMGIYFIVSLVIQPISGFESKSFGEVISSSDGDFSAMKMWSIPGIKVYYGLSGLLSLVLAPLYVGIIYMANKYNFRQPMQVSDLFIGYRQNFVNVLIYSLISSIVIGISFMLCFIPAFFVLPFFLLGYPVLLFENASFSEALSKSFNTAKDNYGVFLGASFLGLLISVAGILLCGIGIIATMPFYFAVMYSAYCAFCGVPRQLELKN